MKLSYPTYDLILDTRRAKSNGVFPVKLRLTYQRIQQYYKLKIEADEPTWQSMLIGKRTKPINDLRNSVDAVKARTALVIRWFETNEQPFDFDIFEKEFFKGNHDSFREKKASRDLYATFEQHIAQLNQDERASTASSYTNAFRSLQKFQPKMEFQDVTPTWLRTYEQSMINAGKSITTVGIYLRALRVLLNQAVEKNIITSKQYPFGKNRYQIPASNNTKKALTIDEVRAIRSYPAEVGSSEDKARDIWIFSYLCNGMNLKDICQLRWKDQQGDKIIFSRAKTKRTTRANPRDITVIVTDPVQKIIDKWGSRERLPEGRLFPFIPLGLTPQQELAAKRDFIKFVNKYMKRIGVELGIKIPLTTYTARHTHATVLKRSGASTEQISENLGHSNLLTTQRYLDSFDDSVKRDLASALL